MQSADQLHLANEAIQLKAAFLLGVALTGNDMGLAQRDLLVPDFRAFSKSDLRRIIRDLRHETSKVGRRIFRDWNRIPFKTAVHWMVEKRRLWIASGQPIWELGRVSEVEAVMGPLAFREAMECPPYAQVVLQGFVGAAIRHPEYHLARDLALHVNLLLDAENIDQDLSRRGLPRSSEVSQSLARSVILACYNLLESFTSGLVAASRVEQPNLPAEIRHKLEEPDKKRQSLKCRFEDVPALITGRPDAMSEYRATVLEPLFSQHKWRRDAFVHCEPGPSPSRYGTVKEELFHDTDLSVVRETVQLTIQAICASWKQVYGSPGPRWLPMPDERGRFPKIAVRLVDPILPKAG